MRLVTNLVIFFLLSACQVNSRQVENYGDINTTTGGIALSSQQEHPSGWGRSECLLCHNVKLNIHRGPNSPVDADAIVFLTQQNGGARYCLTCHGPNGL